MTFIEFMNKAWTAVDIPTIGSVVDRRVCYGSEPDIQLTVDKYDGTGITFVSAKDLFELQQGVA